VGECPCPFLGIVGCNNTAALFAPEFIKLHNDILKVHIRYVVVRVFLPKNFLFLKKRKTSLGVILV